MVIYSKGGFNMKKYKKPHFRSNKEMTAMIVSIGITFVFLGVIYSTKGISISSTFIFSIAISGLLFIVADLIKIFLDRHDPSTYNKIASLVDFFRDTCLIGSVFTLISFPYLFTPSDMMENLATGFSIITIGLTIVTIAFKNFFENREELNYVFELAETALEQTERAIDNAERAQDEAKKAQDQAKKALSIIVRAEDHTEKTQI